MWRFGCCASSTGLVLVIAPLVRTRENWLFHCNKQKVPVLYLHAVVHQLWYLPTKSYLIVLLYKLTQPLIGVYTSDFSIYSCNCREYMLKSGHYPDGCCWQYAIHIYPHAPPLTMHSSICTCYPCMYVHHYKMHTKGVMLYVKSCSLYRWCWSGRPGWWRCYYSILPAASRVYLSPLLA